MSTFCGPSAIILSQIEQFSTRGVDKTYLDEMCQSMILLKIVFIVSSSNSLIVMVLKCLKNLGVTGFLPPPGGPMAAISWISISLIGVISFKSYQFQ